MLLSKLFIHTVHTVSPTLCRERKVPRVCFAWCWVKIHIPTTLTLLPAPSCFGQDLVGPLVGVTPLKTRWVFQNDSTNFLWLPVDSLWQHVICFHEDGGAAVCLRLLTKPSGTASPKSLHGEEESRQIIRPDQTPQISRTRESALSNKQPEGIQLTHS